MVLAWGFITVTAMGLKLFSVEQMVEVFSSDKLYSDDMLLWPYVVLNPLREAGILLGRSYGWKKKKR